MISNPKVGMGIVATFPDGHKEKGSLIYQRMSVYSDFTEPKAYCVRLDSRSNDPSYSGTLFLAEDVVAE